MNITTHTCGIPIGPWPLDNVLRTIGVRWRETLLGGLQPVAQDPFTKRMEV